MAITKLRFPKGPCDTDKLISLTTEWLKWNDEEQLWLLKQTFHAACNDKLLEQARIVWIKAMEAYHAAP